MPALVGMLSGNRDLFLDQMNLIQIKSRSELGSCLLLSNE